MFPSHPLCSQKFQEALGNEGEKTAHQDLKNDDFKDQIERERRGEGEREMLLCGQYLSDRVSLESRVRERKREKERERRIDRERERERARGQTQDAAVT